MSESRVRENLMHGLMRGKRAKPSNLLYRNLDEERKKYMTFFTSSVTGLKTVVTAIGAGVAVWGIINLLEGYGNDNPGAKSQGIKQLMSGGGIVVIAQTVIPQLTTLFS